MPSSPSRHPTASDITTSSPSTARCAMPAIAGEVDRAAELLESHLRATLEGVGAIAARGSGSGPAQAPGATAHPARSAPPGLGSPGKPDSQLRARSARPSASERGSGAPFGFAEWGEGREPLVELEVAVEDRLASSLPGALDRPVAQRPQAIGEHLEHAVRGVHAGFRPDVGLQRSSATTSTSCGSSGSLISFLACAAGASGVGLGTARRTGRSTTLGAGRGSDRPGSEASCSRRHSARLGAVLCRGPGVAVPVVGNVRVPARHRAERRTGLADCTSRRCTRSTARRSRSAPCSYCSASRSSDPRDSVRARSRARRKSGA